MLSNVAPAGLYNLGPGARVPGEDDKTLQNAWPEPLDKITPLDMSIRKICRINYECPSSHTSGIIIKLKDAPESTNEKKESDQCQTTNACKCPGHSK